MTNKFNISACTLHILAMFLMFLDHLWATLLPAQEWMTCLGRIAFPIFAFMTVEGYFHTHNLKKYLLRLFICALISEIPFDLMSNGLLFYPYHQNVIWTFIIGLIGIYLMELAKKKEAVNSLDFIEQMAREKLDMYYPNERVYLDSGM